MLSLSMALNPALLFAVIRIAMASKTTKKTMIDMIKTSCSLPFFITTRYIRKEVKTDSSKLS
jgi:hypothetical protein